MGKVSDLPTDYAFTGQKQDSTGLMYFNARYFDPKIGAFISPDTLVADPTSLYDYNRYMAFRGNPVKYTDPTGHFVWAFAAAGIGAAAGFGYQVYSNYQNGLSGTDAWSSGTLEATVGGAALGLTVAIAPIVAVEMVGAGLTGVGMMAGSTTLFAAGMRANEIATAGNALLFGATTVLDEPIPDPKVLAENKAAELRSQGGKLPTSTSSAVDTKTGKAYYGYSGVHADVKAPEMQKYMNMQSLEKWSVDNCAEFNACNTALLDGAQKTDLSIFTVRTKTGLPFPRCANCQITTEGATILSN